MESDVLVALMTLEMRIYKSSRTSYYIVLRAVLTLDQG